MGESSFQDRFPEMRPIDSPPQLSTIYGIGTTVIGSRDHDPETGTYVKTMVFSVLFVPLLALRAYRVADAIEGGWYFLGKVPLSRFARCWNVFLPLLIAGIVGYFVWQNHVDSPDYKAGKRLAEADRHAAEGRSRQAATVYRELMAGKSSHAGAARDHLRALLEAPKGPAEEVAGAYEVAVDLHRDGDVLLPDLFDRGMALARDHEESDPKGALALVESVRPLAPQPVEHLRARQRLLERLVANQADDAELASRLAVVYEALGEQKRCEALLAPHAAGLGLLDGAAVLGRIYAAQSKFDRAHDLLGPYVEGRLPRLREAEAKYKTAVDQASEQAIQELRGGKAPGFNYERYKAAVKGEQGSLVNAYIEAKLKADSSVRKAQDALRAEAPVALAAIDLGLVRLHRAQGLADEKARRAELEKAEQAFLAARGVAGGSDRYRLSLGQVYYWLGRPAEGRKLFDELLEAEGRASPFLLAVSRALRELGAVSEARPLVEEAYNKEGDERRKQEAALVRSLLATDLDDQITWLSRSNPASLEVQASLSTTRGHKAAQDGRDDEAAGHFRTALSAYAKMAPSDATLNNSAIIHLALYRLVQEQEELTRGLDKLERALALQPQNSILTHNVASAALESAVRDVIGPALNFKVLKREASLGLLDYLHRDQAGRRRTAEALRKHPGFLKARAHHEKLLVLAPQRADSYRELGEMLSFVEDLAGLRKTADRLAGANLDLKDASRETLDYFQGKKDEKTRQDLKKARGRLEAVLVEARKVGGATFAAAAGGLLRQRIAESFLGDAVDADAAVALAEEAHRAAPSRGTQGLLMSATELRAHQALVRANPEYAALAEKTRRSLGPALLSYVLGKGGPLAKEALAQPDVQKAVALVAEQAKAFPDTQGPWSWARLRFARPAEAAAIAGRARTDAVQEAQRRIDHAVSPLSAGGALEAHWALLLAGKEAEAEAVLRQAAARGVPLPVGKE
jgi:hypothetical protein